jgi:hypothetical protein
MENRLRLALITVLALPPMGFAAEGFVLKAGQEGQLFDGIVIKVSPYG